MDDESELLATELKGAFLRLGLASWPDDEQRTMWQRRLIAVADASKHDVARARQRLAKLDDEWVEQEQNR